MEKSWNFFIRFLWEPQVTTDLLLSDCRRRSDRPRLVLALAAVPTTLNRASHIKTASRRRCLLATTTSNKPPPSYYKSSIFIFNIFTREGFYRSGRVHVHFRCRSHPCYYTASQWQRLCFIPTFMGGICHCLLLKQS